DSRWYLRRAMRCASGSLAQRKRVFGALRGPSDEGAGRRTDAGALGKVTIAARAEGGQYTLVEVSTDQLGESELDRLAKRFLAEVHKQVDPGHELRGAY